ncbi:MAG: ATP-grasp domain-containing protein [Anaerolineae bacterium]|nr:ATP-grasp domain-containing protein [Gemmatimonadaceae bacterium]
MTARRILVTDGEQRAALAVVRSLGKAGHHVQVCSTRGRSLAGASRFSRGESRVPDALAGAERFSDSIVALARKDRIEVLLPITDASLLALLPERERLSGICVPFADAETHRAISDKGRLLEIAQSLGISVPEQRRINAPDEWGEIDPGSLIFPIVLKPSRSVADSGNGLVKLSVRHASSASQLQDRIKSLDAAAYPLLVQQRIIGPGSGIFILLWDDELLATFAHRRIREKPPSGGVSVYRESIPADPKLVALSRALLAHFAWRGVAMIEYKVDAASGKQYLMEINGRFWGSLQLATDSGVDFPAQLVAAALGENPAPVSDYRIGVRSRWWWGDVDHLLARVRRSNQALALPPGAPSRLGAVRDFLAIWRPGDRNEILRLEDPAPFWLETTEWFRGR